MSVDKLSPKELEEKFETFLFNMSDALDQLKVKFENQGFKFDYSIESLSDLEEYIKKNGITIKDDDYNDLSSYVGEIVRKNFGGKWICNLDDVNNSLYYGFPVISGHTNTNLLFSPFHAVKIFILRPKKGHFRTAIENQIHPQPIDWSNLPTEK